MKRYRWYHVLTLILISPFMSAGFLYHWIVLAFLAGRDIAQEVFEIMDREAP